MDSGSREMGSISREMKFISREIKKISREIKKISRVYFGVLRPKASHSILYAVNKRVLYSAGNVTPDNNEVFLII
jgi:hypothetical protein